MRATLERDATGPGIARRNTGGCALKFGKCRNVADGCAITALRADIPIDERCEHARHQVVEVVAMECPQARIVGVEHDFHGGLRWHENGVADGSRNIPVIDLHHLKYMPMKVHRMRHHRRVLEDDLDAFAAVCGPGQSLHPVDGHAPYISHHVAGELDGNRTVRRLRGERLFGNKPQLLIEPNSGSDLIRA